MRHVAPSGIHRQGYKFSSFGSSYAPLGCAADHYDRLQKIMRKVVKHLQLDGSQSCALPVISWSIAAYFTESMMLMSVKSRVARSSEHRFHEHYIDLSPAHKTLEGVGAVQYWTMHVQKADVDSIADAEHFCHMEHMPQHLPPFHTGNV